MNKDNVAVLKKARGMCLLYGITCFVAGIIGFAVWDAYALGSLLLLVAILGFWRISHKMKYILQTEEPKYFKETDHDRDGHGRRA